MENNLLSQVRVVAVDQEVDVWVLGRTRIRFRVGTFFRLSRAMSSHTTTLLVSYDPPGQAVLLSTDTEVVIAPKSRSNLPKKAPDSKRSKVQEVPPITIPTNKKNGSVDTTLTLRVLPSEFFLQIATSNLEPLLQTLLYVSPGTLREMTDGQPDLPMVQVKRLNPPISRTSENAEGSRSSDSSDTATPTSKVLQGSKVTTSQTSNRPPAACALRSHVAIPNRHCVLIRGSSGDVDGAGNWDIIM